MDRRIELLDEIISLNDAEIAKINKNASVKREPMPKNDREKCAYIRNVNQHLGRIKYEIIQSIVYSKSGLNIKILNFEELEKRISEYKKMFPDTAADMEHIVNCLTKEYEHSGESKSVFGIQISEEWEDKCYGFEFAWFSQDIVYYRYVGIIKS